MKVFFDAAKRFTTALLILLGLVVLCFSVTAIEPRVGIVIGIAVLIVAGFAVIKPIKSVGLQNRAFNLSVAIFVGFTTTMAATGLLMDAQKADAEMLALKANDPEAYLSALFEKDKELWLSELEVIDPKRHRAEVAKLEAEQAEREASEQAEREAEEARKEAERVEREAAERAERTAREAAERAEREAEAAQERAEACGERSETIAYVMSQEFIERRLRAPSTAEFPWATEISVDAIGDCRFRIIAYVDAQNGFGAMIRSHYGAVLEHHPESETWSLVSMDFEG